MRIVFMGSGALACRPLRRLIEADGLDVVAVVTQPDRPKGRKLKISASAVGDCAQRAGLPVLTPVRVNEEGSVSAIRTYAPDAIVVAAYGQILRKALLDMPPKGCFNIHASLLPAYRGAAPIQWAIANGEEKTGVTIMCMNERMDEGSVILQAEVVIAPDDTTETLEVKLADKGADLLLSALRGVDAGVLTCCPQDERQATRAPKLHKEDGRIDWSLPASVIANRVRGFYPWPCCYCSVQGPAGPEDGEPTTATLKVLRADVEDGQGVPGEILSVSKDGILVATGAGGLRLREVQPEGRKRMAAAAYVCGHPLKPGDRLPDGREGQETKQ